MSFIQTLRSRELLAQITHEEELEEFLVTGQRVAYIGFDPTADSLHCGSLLQAMTLRRWQKAGHKAVVLVGGGTAKVGDPTGKTDLRKMMTEETIAKNIECMKEQLSRFIDIDEDAKVGVLVNNADWLEKLQYLPFLRDIGRHFSVNRMLTAECFKQRLEKGLTFLEFNYMLLQSYDFLELNKSLYVSIQLGGDDQWSNMLSGVDLVRRVRQKKAFCITTPLLTTSDGRKMGKTEKGAVWLDANKTSTFDFFQYWRNVEDQSVRKCFLYLTDLPVEEVNELCNVDGAAINQAKVRLAYEITKIVHGDASAEKAREAAAKLFEKGGSSGNEPLVLLDSGEYGESKGVLDLMVLAKIVPTKSEARRLIQQGGLSIGGKKVENVKEEISRSLIAEGEGCLVQKGRKSFYRLRFS